MLQDEFPVGNYTGQKYKNLLITSRQRRGIVELIEKLHHLQQYKPETLYLATSIADRYIINQAIVGNSAPDAVVLAVTCVMLAGKLEQEESPSFNVLSSFMEQSSLRFSIQKKYFIRLENKVCRALEMDLTFTSPLPFLERFLRILDLDRPHDQEGRTVTKLAKQICLQTMRTAAFLEFRPSTIAAGCLLMAIKQHSLKRSTSKTNSERSSSALTSR